jgi:D-sedoheptulose 7-phosphate isomerase
MPDILALIDEHQAVVSNLRDVSASIETAAARMAQALRDGGKILWMGNGGSASDSQHLAAEFVGRFSRHRQALASIALTTDTSILTAISNDYGFDFIFARQIEALAGPNDVVVAISTSGNSPNIIYGIETARKLGASTIGFTGRTGGAMKDLVDICIQVPSDVVARIQEAHILIGHICCEWVESRMIAKPTEIAHV